VGGVADYTAILSSRLVEVSGGTVEPVLVHAGRTSTDDIEVDYPVVNLSGKCSATALAETINRLAEEAQDPTVVLLEYSGYGYAKRGAPLWLAQALRSVCGKIALPLITMFHELYATGPVYTSAFWVSPLQRRVASQLAQMSSAVVSNRKSATAWLRPHLRPSISLSVQPVFSNVGEPDHLPPYSDRDPHIITFGASARKSEIYQKNSEALSRLLNLSTFRSIIDVGPPPSSTPSIQNIVSFHGTLPAEEVSALFVNARLGLVCYPGSRLGKSGTVAAFASHGIPFILFDEDPEPMDSSPYVEEKHFWRWSTLSKTNRLLKVSALKDMSDALKAHYDRRIHSYRSARAVYSAVNGVLEASSNSSFV
jgi:hypothetical protein